MRKNNGGQTAWGSANFGLLSALFGKLRSLSLREFVERLLPQRVDLVFYKACLKVHEPKSLAKIPVAIEKVATPSILTYQVLVDDKIVHRSLVRLFSLRPVQFGFGAHPVIVDCFTMPEYRGLRIYPHVLNYILCDLQAADSTQEIYIWTDVKNRASIAAIERVGFDFVARCKGLRVGPFMLGRSRCSNREVLADAGLDKEDGHKSASPHM